MVKKENEQLKARVQELEAENQELKKQSQHKKEEVSKNDLTNEKIDYENRKVLVDGEWLELPPGFEMEGKKYEYLALTARNQRDNKQKELANASPKII